MQAAPLLSLATLAHRIRWGAYWYFSRLSSKRPILRNVLATPCTARRYGRTVTNDHACARLANSPARQFARGMHTLPRWVYAERRAVWLRFRPPACGERKGLDVFVGCRELRLSPTEAVGFTRITDVPPPEGPRDGPPRPAIAIANTAGTLLLRRRRSTHTHTHTPLQTTPSVGVFARGTLRTGTDSSVSTSFSPACSAAGAHASAVR